MLSSEQREKAKQRWMEAFDKIYPKCESLFRWDSTLVITDTETMVCYGEDGKAYTLQVAPWEKDEEDVNILYICDGKKCDNCSEECLHTSNIRHAASFCEKEPNLYVQNIVQLSQPIDMTNVVIEEEE